MEEKKIFRCAVYTRKSHEDGLEQEFNSLDAQRDSGEAYIASQKMNGWRLLPDRYDDGGFSGGTMERPALQKLLSDVDAGKIDIIVVYKLDRLSRSLLDFMKLIEVLEARKVSFVSVTQQFNTSDSSGRLMLNILLSFAQYEREIIAERIRDKIAGAKRRGKFCGGTPVLGYDIHQDGRKLIVNEKEAELVRFIFKRYTELGSAKTLVCELNEKGYSTKTRTSENGRVHQGIEFNTGHIYRLIENPVYIGRVYHKGNTYPGEHVAIVPSELWEKTQSMLKASECSGRMKSYIAVPLKGQLRCGYCGCALTPNYATHGPRRYVYFHCLKDSKRGKNICPLRRIPASEIENAVVQQLGSVFRAPTLLAKTYLLFKDKQDTEKESLRKQQDELLKAMEDVRGKMSGIAANENLETESMKLQQELIRLGNETIEVNNQLANLKAVPLDKGDVIKAFENIQSLWDELFPGERQRLLFLLVDHVTVWLDSMQIELKTSDMAALVSEVISAQAEGNK